MGRLFTKKWKILIFLGPHSQPSAPIDVKFCTAKRTPVPVGPAKFDLNRCNESPLRGEKPDFWPKVKTILAVCRYAAILPVISN